MIDLHLIFFIVLNVIINLFLYLIINLQLIDDVLFFSHNIFSLFFLIVYFLFVIENGDHFGDAL